MDHKFEFQLKRKPECETSQCYHHRASASPRHCSSTTLGTRLCRRQRRTRCRRTRTRDPGPTHCTRRRSRRCNTSHSASHSRSAPDITRRCARRPRQRISTQTRSVEGRTGGLEVVEARSPVAVEDAGRVGADVGVAETTRFGGEGQGGEGGYVHGARGFDGLPRGAGGGVGVEGGRAAATSAGVVGCGGCRGSVGGSGDVAGKGAGVGRDGAAAELGEFGG